MSVDMYPTLFYDYIHSYIRLSQDCIARVCMGIYYKLHFFQRVSTYVCFKSLPFGTQTKALEDVFTV